MRGVESSWIMPGMGLRALAVVSLGAALLITAPLGAFAEPPPETPSTDAASGSVHPPSEAAGQTVTLTGPFEPPPPPPSKKRSAKTPASSAKTATKPPQPAPSPPAAPRRRAVTTTPARQHLVVHSAAKPRVRVHGGPSRRVADPPASRGGVSAAVAARPASATPQVARAVGASAVAPTKPHSSMNWWLPLVIAVGLLLVLVAIQFAYGRWATRRSDRQWAKHFDKVPTDT